MAGRVALIALGVVWVTLIFWTFKDARRRIEDQLVVAVAVLTSLVFPFLGTLVYLILRPAEYLMDVKERQLEILAMEQELRSIRICPNCREPVKEEFVACPKCRRPLRETCVSCGRPLEYWWKLCPYCGRDVVATQQRPETEAELLEVN